MPFIRNQSCKEMPCFKLLKPPPFVRGNEKNKSFEECKEKIKKDLSLNHCD